MTDFRIKENREQAFVEWMVWSIQNEDCDPSLFLTNYLFDRYEHNIEQKLWICWLYGTTYYLPTAWVVFNEFPDFELVDQTRLEQWNAKNYLRLRYQTDTKYNKGHLPSQFASYRDWVHSSALNQRTKLREFVKETSSPTENFDRLYAEVVNNLHKFGRYTAWFYLQTLKHCAGVNIDAPDLKLRDSGSRSHRNGLLFAVGWDDRVDQPLTEVQYQELDKLAATMLFHVKELLPIHLQFKADFFAMETCLCSFRKIFRNKHTRWLGYYLARQAHEIEVVEKDGWDGIFWKPFWDGRKEILNDLAIESHRKEDQPTNTFLTTGKLQLWSDASGLGIFFT